MAQKHNGAHVRASVKWQKEQVLKGRCRSCGKPAGEFYLCPRHRKMEAERKKARRAELKKRGGQRVKKKVLPVASA